MISLPNLDSEYFFHRWDDRRATLSEMRRAALALSEMNGALEAGWSAWHSRRVEEMREEDRPEESALPLPPDLIETLVDLARANHEADFRWLARSAGVGEEQLEELWAGTRRRVGR